MALFPDIAQSLLTAEQQESTPAALLRDGGELQRVMSELPVA